MKLFLSVGLCMFFNLCYSQIVFAKFADIDTLDKAKFEVIYQYDVTDVVKQEQQTTYDILQIGQKISKFYNYSTYRTDTAVLTMDRHRISRMEANQLFNKYKLSPTFDKTEILKNQKERKIIVRDKVFTDKYFYEEDYPNFEWKIDSSDTLTIAGYLCKKATTHFRGRTWTVWYTSKISSSEGPWKFNGLPGLILRAEDSDKEHIFSAITIRKNNSAIIQDRLDFIKTKREKLNKLMGEYKQKPSTFASGSKYAPKNKDGKEIKPKGFSLFYNSIEKE